MLSSYFRSEYFCIAKIAKRLIELVRIRVCSHWVWSRMQRSETLSANTRFGIDSQIEGSFKISETRYLLRP
ncbi:hypothetical protein OICFNHDK_2712 [Methylobacterium bullatum]|uniref:Uncharacterized protein n=1 Tax=Methylobacterium bullatum TaxID=570505 RepID=A0AAV4Z8I2_9HYPH|nr:hypothetical protein OICFNHDK_2712 [Methylobacterium bullatum]